MVHYQLRWRERRARWVSSRQLCDPRVIEAAPIAHAVAKSFVLAHHYSGSYPSVRCRVGIFERGDLVGVATFGLPAGPRVLHAWTGFGREEAIELNRFVLLDEVGYNAESRALKLARHVLLEQLPSLKALLAFSDPVLRESLDGTVTLPGHVGTIYQATNAAYRGRTGARRLVLDHEGRAISARTKSVSSSRVMLMPSKGFLTRELCHVVLASRFRHGSHARSKAFAGCLTQAITAMSGRSCVATDSSRAIPIQKCPILCSSGCFDGLCVSNFMPSQIFDVLK